MVNTPQALCKTSPGTSQCSRPRIPYVCFVFPVVTIAEGGWPLPWARRWATFGPSGPVPGPGQGAHKIWQESARTYQLLPKKLFKTLHDRPKDSRRQSAEHAARMPPGMGRASPRTPQGNRPSMPHLTWPAPPQECANSPKQLLTAIAQELPKKSPRNYQRTCQRNRSIMLEEPYEITPFTPTRHRPRMPPKFGQDPPEDVARLPPGTPPKQSPKKPRRVGQDLTRTL